MSSVWWKNAHRPLDKKSASPSAGKFAGIKKIAKTAGEDEYPLMPILIGIATAMIILWWLQTWELENVFFEYRLIANIMMVSVITSSIVLFQRYTINHEKRRMYLAITFAMTGVSIVLFVLVVPFLHAQQTDAELIRQLRLWGAYAVRVIFSFLLFVSLFAEQSRKRDMNINVGWFMTVGSMLIAVFYVALSLFELPSHFTYGMFYRLEEVIPLALYVIGFVVILHKKIWRTDTMMYHLLIVLALETVGTSALLLTPSSLHILEIVGYFFIAAGIIFPFFSIQSSMLRAYRYAERYRINENWMTRTSGGTKGGNELSPVIFREIAQQLNEALAITDTSGRIIFANTYMTEMTGKRNDQIMNKLPTIWQHKSIAPDFYPRIFARIQKDKVMYEGQVQNAYANNPEKGYSAHVRITPVLNEFGDISCCILQQKNIVQDQERTHLLRQMIDTMPLGIMIVDVPSLRISLTNTQAEYLLSSSGFNIRTTKTLDDLAANLQTVEGKPYKKEALPPYLTMAQQKESEVNDVAVFLEQGTNPVMVWKMKATPFFHEDGTMHSMLIAFDDISRHREYEHKMSDFISVASHQLRTPLTSIKWTLDTLRRSDTKLSNEDSRLMFNTCYEASERMMTTIHQLLQVAELEGGNFTTKIQTVDFIAVIQESLTTLKLLMEKKKIHFKQSILRAPPPLHFNKFFLSQIVQNLLENAVKYSNEGGEIDSIITVKGDYIEWTLHDNGIGIPKQSLGRLFEKFFRADNAQRAYPDGTGLGLYIVKSTLDTSGGKIKIESDEGKGTTVYITIPVVQEDAQQKISNYFSVDPPSS